MRKGIVLVLLVLLTGCADEGSKDTLKDNFEGCLFNVLEEALPSDGPDLNGKISFAFEPDLGTTDYVLYPEGPERAGDLERMVGKTTAACDDDSSAQLKVYVTWEDETRRHKELPVESLCVCLPTDESRD